MPTLIGRCGGGGGGLSELQGQYQSSVFSGFGGTFGPLSFDTLLTGTDVLNRTVPTLPTVTRTGYWSFTIGAGAAQNLPVGTALTLGLQLDTAGDDETWSLGPVVANATFPEPQLTLTAVMWLASGAGIQAQLTADNPAPKNFQMYPALVAFLGGS